MPVRSLITSTILLVVATGVLAQPASPAPDAPQPMTLTAQQGRQLMLDQLKIPASTMRRGPSAMNPSAPDYQNTDEARANPWPHLPAMMVCKDRTVVTTPEVWWNKRRPELVEYFDAEVYGRVPKDVPKVTWVVAETQTDGGAVVKRLSGQVDNSACPAIAVTLSRTLATPADAGGPAPVFMDFGGGGGRREYLAKGWGYCSINPGSIQADNGD